MILLTKKKQFNLKPHVLILHCAYNLDKLEDFPSLNCKKNQQYQSQVTSKKVADKNLSFSYE